MISLKSICGLLNLEESHSYKIIYSGILKGAVNGCKLLILLVGAGRFERPTPCAQGRCATRLRYAPTVLILHRFRSMGSVRKLSFDTAHLLLW